MHSEKLLIGWRTGVHSEKCKQPPLPWLLHCLLSVTALMLLKGYKENIFHHFLLLLYFSFFIYCMHMIAYHDKDVGIRLLVRLVLTLTI